jgi:hypothetical protein
MVMCISGGGRCRNEREYRHVDAGKTVDEMSMIAATALSFRPFPKVQAAPLPA